MLVQEVQDVSGNPYYLDQDQIDELTMEIEELKVFSTEVRKILTDRTSSSGSRTGASSSSRRHGSERDGGRHHEGSAPMAMMEHY